MRGSASMPTTTSRIEDSRERQRHLRRWLRHHALDAHCLDSDVQLGAVQLRFERGPLPAVVFQEMPSSFLQVDRYEVGEVAVQGSTSTIYEARDTAVQRDLALKIMLPESQRDPTAVLRFVREVQITGQMAHPGIVPVYETRTRPRRASFFRHALHRRRVARRNPRAPRRARRTHARALRFRGASPALAKKICDTIAFAHSRGVVHNALAPELIQVGSFGEVFVTQWSLALVQPEPFGDARHVRASESTAIAPLSPYTTPEQAAGHLHEIDLRTDVFALGGCSTAS